MIESIINNNLCISCGLCGAVCPVKCISFHAERGLNLPLINHKICINCGKCIRVCPGKGFNFSKITQGGGGIALLLELR